MNFNLFEAEDQIISTAEKLLQEERVPDYHAAFRTLLADYKQLYKTSKRLLRFSDRNEEKLKETTQALSQRTTELLASQERLRQAQAREMAFASEIQMAMLPTSYAVLGQQSRYEISAILEPAKAVGGDLYDYFLIDPQHLFFVIGDVSGKGIPAALFMVKAITLLKTVAQETALLADIVNTVNKRLWMDNDACMFITLVCGILDINTGDMQCCNAGHTAPLIQSAERSYFTQWPSGPSLGLTEQPVFPVSKLHLAAGESLLLYTDGVTEAFNAAGECFSEERLLQLFIGNTGVVNAKTMTSLAFTAVKDFTQQAVQSDDITIMSLHHGITGLYDS